MKDEYSYDDNEFAAGAGINKITNAYSKIFESIRDIADDGVGSALCGDSKEIHETIRKLGTRLRALTEVSSLDKKIVGPSGKVFNALGQETDEEVGEDEEVLTEKELESKLDDIVKGVSEYTVGEADEALAVMENENVQDDGKDHGDIDDIDW